MNDNPNRLTDFVDSERKRFSDEHGNRFAFSFSQVRRYYEFLNIISEKHKKASKDFISNSESLQSISLSGGWKSYDEWEPIWEEHLRVYYALHLEIESFYLFAKILLDQIARFIEFYFGSVRKKSLDSHDELTKHLDDYAKAKGLIIPPSLVEMIQTLKRDISDYRDYEIAHHKSPRTIRGTGFDTSGKVRIISSKFYPSESEKQVETISLPDLRKEIDDYLEGVIELIKVNGDKTTVKLVTETADNK
jgi:hypothetical protein